MPVHEGLRKRTVRLETLAECTDPAAFDAFIAGEAPGERRWEVFELTQSQDVARWVEDPATIEGIPENLAHLREEIERLHARPVRLLDAGCYGGYAYDFLTRAGFGPDRLDSLGVDVQPRAVEGARHAHAGAPSARFERGDVFRLADRFDARAFDAVFCSRVLNRLPHLERAVGNLLHAARTALVVVVRFEDPPTCKRLRETDLESGDGVVYDFRTFRPQEFEALAGGAEVVVRRTSNPLSTVIFRR